MNGQKTKQSMSNVDIYTISNELNNLLTGARVDKSFQPTPDTVVMRFHVSGTGRVDLVMQCGVRIHTSQYPLENPQNPPVFPMLLRKRVKGGHVLSVKQHNFDRIIEIKIKKEQIYTLIIELFNDGNLILLDEEDTIVLPLKRDKRTQRDISSKQTYAYPVKEVLNPIELTHEDLTNLFKDSDLNLVKTLAVNGLGRLYAEEIILRANEYESIDKTTPANELNETQTANILKGFKEIFDPIRNLEFKAQIIKGIDVTPVDLKEYEDKEKEYYDNFNQACDEFFSKRVNKDIVKIKEAAWTKKVNKFQKRLEMQEETLQKFKDTIETCNHRGEVIYSNYVAIENIINVVNQAKDKSYSFKEIGKILQKAKKEGMAEAQIFESMDKMGVITLKIDDTTVNIDPKKTIPENTEVYYEKSKKSKRKIKGALIAIEKTKKQLEEIKSKKDIAMEQISIPKKRVKKDLKWFEKLRWFLSSDNTLVIGGRDTNSNETVVKKHLDNNDVYMHADIYGASSVVVKLQGNELNNQLIKESAIFSASFSSAWKNNYGNQDVYWVHPDQVSKTTKSGEYTSKGSFIINGKKNYIRKANLQIAIGIVDYEGKRIMAGPVDALEKHSKNFVVIKPGNTKKQKIAEKILKIINEDNLLTIDDLIRVLPSGKCDIDHKYHERKKYEK